MKRSDVYVARIYQARCRVPGCDWAGELLGEITEANGDRTAHIEWHRQREREKRGTE